MHGDVRGQRRSWSVGLLLWMLSPGAAAVDGGPIRVVLRGYARPTTIQEYLQALSDSCRISKGLSIERLPNLPAALLQRTPDMEVEELFDDERWARYRRSASFVVDSANCQPIILRSFQVEVIDGCRRSLSGHKGSRQTDDGEVPETTFFDRAVSCSGRSTKRATDLSGLPVDDAGLGVPCVWTVDIVARDLKQPAGRRSGTDSCVYARRPDVAFPSDSKPVVVRMRLGTRNAHGGDVGELIPMPAELKLAEFSDGTAIPPARFTREGVEAFLRQPNKQALGAAR